MQAGDMQLGTVFANNQVLFVPHFQRPYVWKDDENWAPLWADVRQAAEDVEAEQATGGEQDDPRMYFLGAVVTQQRRRQPQRLASMHVIDGQQRLTTLQVVLAAARAVALAAGLDATAGQLDGMVENPAKTVHANHPEDRGKLVPLPQDRDGFTWAMRRDTTQGTALTDHRLVQARRWFEDAITAWTAEAASPADRLDALRFALEDRVQLVHIVLDVKDDPQVIFEALNHRGVRLNPADLIKNLLFQTVDRQGEHARSDSLLMQHWLPFDSSPWRDEVTSGRIKRSRMDVFLAHWLTMRSGAEVSVEHLFRDFKAWLQQADRNAGDVIVEIRRYGEQYLRLLALPADTATGRLVDAMQATTTNTPWPVLLHLYGTEVPNGQRDGVAAALDSYLMRRAVCGLTSKDYNNVMRGLLAELAAAPPGQEAATVEAKLAGETAPSRFWPSDAQFRRGLLGPALYVRILKGRLRALLVGLDNHLTTGLTEATADRRAWDSGLTIEHLLPQRWRQHWPLAEQTLDAEVARDDTVHRLGNLTLLTAKLNPTVGNRAWNQKRADIGTHSLLRLTSSSVLHAPPSVAGEWTDQEWIEAWDEGRIAARGRWLADQAVLAWPRPDGATDDLANEDLDRTETETPRGTVSNVGDLLAAGLLTPGDELVWMRPRAGEVHRCTVRADGQLEHSDGVVSATPSGACGHATGGGSHNGWASWRVPAQGSVLLFDLHEQLVASGESVDA